MCTMLFDEEEGHNPLPLPMHEISDVNFSVTRRFHPVLAVFKQEHRVLASIGPTRQRFHAGIIGLPSVIIGD